MLRAYSLYVIKMYTISLSKWLGFFPLDNPSWSIPFLPFLLFLFWCRIVTVTHCSRQNVCRLLTHAHDYLKVLGQDCQVVTFNMSLELQGVKSIRLHVVQI